MFKIDEKEVDAVANIIKSGKIFRYNPGSCTEFLEKEWAEKIGTKYSLATSSGTASLICALAALGIGPGDEVIVPGYTFIATAAAVLAVGAIPILADVDETLTLDAADVERKISPFTKAVIPVHMQGFPCNMDAIIAVAKKHSLSVVEDACQADGGSYKGKRLGSIGDAGANSFNFFKIIGAGEGGALVTNNKAVYERAVIQHDCGNTFFTGRDMSVNLFMGWNFRMSDILAAVMRVQVTRLDGILSSLRKEKAFLRESLAAASSFRVSPSHDEAGDCGTTLALLFPSGTAAASFIDTVKADGVGGAHSPINTGKHVYSNWQAILEKQGAHHPDRNPYKFAQREITYTKDMLPNTLDILARTVYVPMHIDHSLEQQNIMLKAMLAADGQALNAVRKSA
ncbi:MAG: DegT/DnrJ/EryC1/StrS family aminotransferase [Spirochaetes bacterium]|nr:DegT/DnrJ/EryC1/StrS family aminotransferase [Spirochaetota bacterium]